MEVQERTVLSHPAVHGLSNRSAYGEALIRMPN
jgi:hypothetical protein